MVFSAGITIFKILLRITKLTIDIILVSLAYATFSGAAVTSYFYHKFYKKYDKQLKEAFSLLQQKSLIRLEDYYLYEQMGMLGFGLRVSLIRMIMKGKTFQLEKKRWVTSEAKQVLVENFDWLWVKAFYKLLNCIMGLGLVFFVSGIIIKYR